eukprot:scaffold421364_cov71-Attheya_sp.AAC.2
MNMIKARTQVEDDYLSKPFGTVLHEYKRVVHGTDENELNEEATFVLCLADGKDELVAEYHGNVQKLALFFIETGDNPKPGMVLRICPAVISPPYQRAGHGKSMFQAVYDIASGTYESKL